MMVLITYDVCTTTPAGQRRLRKVAKICVNYGQRVQNSVFECVLDAALFRNVQHQLAKVIDPQTDSMRFYLLGNNYRQKVEHMGAKPSFDVAGPLIV